jgi:hypothetical protein
MITARTFCVPVNAFVGYVHPAICRETNEFLLGLLPGKLRAQVHS